ncbi:hypothetical protein ACO22_06540 [Paracoccidioides brasiliensis]|uniref:RRM domain-containing protein n=1 Tax=Paracoccidioides brasiliensis TaxID=121759 RepID=A0A1D2J751_PARBR|nr:hypothetical protein ACO22_06540 [Paracoccidioides brasiliensis]
MTATHTTRAYGSLLASYLHEMPFEDGTSNSKPPKFGVIKITNIPYAVTKHEVLQFLGRNASPLTPDLGYPVHIIMERSTGKTMDCYVEFPTIPDAEQTLSWVNRCLENFQSPKLGNRHVIVRLSSQDELLNDLFPHAKCVEWRDGVPYVDNSKKDKYCSGFQGFLTGEEIFCTVRHAEVPNRSPYCTKCLQRPYENMTSTLHKYPWYATHCFTVEDRNQLFSATFRLLHALVPKVERGRTIGLDSRVVEDLLRAGLHCPVFNNRQKFVLNIAAKNWNGPKSLSSRYWPFDTLVQKNNASEELVMEYAELIAAGVGSQNPACKIPINTWNPVMHAGSPFGKIWIEWGWGNTHHKWHDAVEYERGALSRLIAEGLQVKNNAENETLPVVSKTPSTSISVGNVPAAGGPTAAGRSNVGSVPTFRFPIRLAHNVHRHTSSAPINLIRDLNPANTSRLTNDDPHSVQPRPRPHSNSISGTSEKTITRNNIFGSVGGKIRRRNRAATAGSRHSPVLEVDEDHYANLV